VALVAIASGLWASVVGAVSDRARRHHGHEVSACRSCSGTGKSSPHSPQRIAMWCCSDHRSRWRCSAWRSSSIHRRSTPSSAWGGVMTTSSSANLLSATAATSPGPGLWGAREGRRAARSWIVCQCPMPGPASPGRWESNGQTVRRTRASVRQGAFTRESVKCAHRRASGARRRTGPRPGGPRRVAGRRPCER
jgi:hypothetical protein